MKTGLTLSAIAAAAICNAAVIAAGSTAEPHAEYETVRVCFQGQGDTLTGVSFTSPVRWPGHLEVEAARAQVERFATGARGEVGSGVATLFEHGRTDKRINLVFVGDGYTADQLDLYHADVDRILGLIFDHEPFRSYKTRFNAYRVDVVSNESGVDNDPTLGVERDTAFDMGFWCNGTERALCADSTKVRAFSALAPADSHVVAIANSSKFGGAAYFGTEIACVSSRSHLTGSTVRHELGHAMFHLEDEYDVGGPPSYTGPEFGRANISILDADEQIATQTKWWRWIGREVEGFDGPVGAHEGARYSSYGIYRPSPRSLMRAHNERFNPPSVEQALRAIHTVDNPWKLFEDGTEPIGGEFIGHHHEFFVEPIHPASHELTVWWQLGNEVLPDVTGNSVRLCELQLQPGQYVLVAKARDDTEWAIDPFTREQYLTSNYYWFIRIDTPPGDRNGDGVLGVADLADFVNDFLVSDPSADLAAPQGTHDLADLVEFVRRFTEPCAG